jgi:hypothetical protein
MTLEAKSGWIRERLNNSTFSSKEKLKIRQWWNREISDMPSCYGNSGKRVLLRF